MTGLSYHNSTRSLFSFTRSFLRIQLERSTSPFFSSLSKDKPTCPLLCKHYFSTLLFHSLFQTDTHCCITRSTVTLLRVGENISHHWHSSLPRLFTRLYAEMMLKSAGEECLACAPWGNSLYSGVSTNRKLKLLHATLLEQANKVKHVRNFRLCLANQFTTFLSIIFPTTLSFQ